MSRLIRLAALTIPVTFALGCTDLETPGSDTETGTASQALTTGECTSGIQFNGQWPSIKAWNGVAPQSVSASQVFVVAPIAGYNNQYILISQVDWMKGRVAWAAWAPASQRPQVMATLSVQPGDIDALGGTRVPPIGITYPPGTDEGQDLIEIAADHFD